STDPCGRLRQLARSTSPPARAASAAASTRAPDGVIARSRARPAPETVGDRLLGRRPEHVVAPLVRGGRLPVGKRLPPVNAPPPAPPAERPVHRGDGPGGILATGRPARIHDARRDPRRPRPRIPGLGEEDWLAGPRREVRERTHGLADARIEGG